MSVAKPSLFARLFSKLDPRLTVGLIISCVFFLLIALSNTFSAYSALVEPNTHSAALRSFAVLLYAVPAMGILRLKRWARWLGVLLCTVASLLGVLTFVAISSSDGAFIVITHGSVLYCLLSKKTRAAFATQSP
jgi:hypothetical protein